MMNYKEPTKEITEMCEVVRPYLAKSKKEDRGDGFKNGTPDEIVKMWEKVGEYYADDDM